VEEGRNFANKLYNACRLRQMGGEPFQPFTGFADLRPYHLNAMAKLDELAVDLERLYGDYRFGEIAHRLYEFLWNDFCDKFLEAVKLDLRDTAPAAAKAASLGVFDAIMGRYLQLLSPYMPHVTEELSERMGYVSPGEFLMQKLLPAVPLLASLGAQEIAAAQAIASEVYESAGRMRNLKAEYKMGSRKDIKFVIKAAPEWLAGEVKVLALLVGAEEITLDSHYEVPKGTPAAVTGVGEVYMPLEGLIDVEAERLRLTKEISNIQLEVKKCEGKLGNASFVERAPPEVVVQETARLEDWKVKLIQLHEMLAALA
jgi:valyl-tRNA synthetase